MVALNFLQKQDLLRVVTLNCEILLQTAKNKNERPGGRPHIHGAICMKLVYFGAFVWLIDSFRAGVQ